MKKMTYLFLIIWLLAWCNNQNNIPSNQKLDNNVSNKKVLKQNNITNKYNIKKQKNSKVKTWNFIKENNFSKKNIEPLSKLDLQEQKQTLSKKKQNNITDKKIEKKSEYHILNNIKNDCFKDYNNELKKLKDIPEEKKKEVKEYCDKQNKVLLENIKIYEQRKNNIKNLNLNSCNSYTVKNLKEKCKIKILLSSYNKKWCDLIKEKDKNLYQKCLKIKKWIEEWKKLKEYKYYYEEYWQNNY